jgi:hypothetical protein
VVADWAPCASWLSPQARIRSANPGGAAAEGLHVGQGGGFERIEGVGQPRPTWPTGLTVFLTHPFPPSQMFGTWRGKTRRVSPRRSRSDN